mmetsp:Transcript_26628/g.70300  ORF Transcript_26628/g.70300 Transcript_26628/m.70300 type:complete len:228 (-) Transcript_26628:628-1311(-)
MPKGRGPEDWDRGLRSTVRHARRGARGRARGSGSGGHRPCRDRRGGAHGAHAAPRGWVPGAVPAGALAEEAPAPALHRRGAGAARRGADPRRGGARPAVGLVGRRRPDERQDVLPPPGQQQKPVGAPGGLLVRGAGEVRRAGAQPAAAGRGGGDRELQPGRPAAGARLRGCAGRLGGHLGSSWLGRDDECEAPAAPGGRGRRGPDRARAHDAAAEDPRVPDPGGQPV